MREREPLCPRQVDVVHEAEVDLGVGREALGVDGTDETGADQGEPLHLSCPLLHGVQRQRPPPRHHDRRHWPARSTPRRQRARRPRPRRTGRR
ncbi:hypothetical protein ACFPRL_22300 [Pseudoclavibacter helvolus]